MCASACCSLAGPTRLTFSERARHFVSLWGHSQRAVVPFGNLEVRCKSRHAATFVVPVMKTTARVCERVANGEVSQSAYHHVTDSRTKRMLSELVSRPSTQRCLATTPRKPQCGHTHVQHQEFLQSHSRHYSTLSGRKPQCGHTHVQHTQTMADSF